MEHDFFAQPKPLCKPVIYDEDFDFFMTDKKKLTKTQRALLKFIVMPFLGLLSIVAVYTGQKFADAVYSSMSGESASYSSDKIFSFANSIDFYQDGRIEFVRNYR
jgi:hypothetical protein